MTDKIITYNTQEIENLIFTIRGKEVMLDKDLAVMYQVETRVLNQAVKRNIDRFPIEFRFQLTNEDFANLSSQVATSNSRSQFVTLKQEENKQGLNLKSQTVTSSNHGGRRYLPYAFTEQGVAMLSAVLRSEVAIQVSIQIMNAFVEMRKVVASHSSLLQKMGDFEMKQLENDQKFNQIFKAWEAGNPKIKQGVFFNGQTFDAYTFVADIVRDAKTSICLIDNYIDDSVLLLFAKRKKSVAVTLYTKTITKVLQQDIKKYNQQYPNITLKKFDKAHDRFLIIDNKIVYHMGASLKDLGKKWFAFSIIDKDAVSVLQKIKEI